MTGSTKKYFVLNVSIANIIVPEVKTRKEAPEINIGATFNSPSISSLRLITYQSTHKQYTQVAF